jgi:hypothetical protein
VPDALSGAALAGVTRVKERNTMIDKCIRLMQLFFICTPVKPALV